jgi:hypothetical protein
MCGKRVTLYDLFTEKSANLLRIVASGPQRAPNADFRRQRRKFSRQQKYLRRRSARSFRAAAKTAAHDASE